MEKVAEVSVSSKYLYRVVSRFSVWPTGPFVEVLVNGVYKWFSVFLLVQAVIPYVYCVRGHFFFVKLGPCVFFVFGGIRMDGNHAVADSAEMVLNSLIVLIYSSLCRLRWESNCNVILLLYNICYINLVTI